MENTALTNSPTGELGRMVDPWLHDVSTLMEIAGVAVIVIGAIVATANFLNRARSGAEVADFGGFRADLGRAILLGLEFLVAADIIGTVAITPSFQNLGVLALIVLIRTFRSFSLEVEIEGRWPWRNAAAEEAKKRRA